MTALSVSVTGSGNDQLVDDSNQFQRNARKEKQKNKCHPDIADAGGQTRQLLIMQGFQCSDNNRRENQQDDENQDQALQKTGKVKDAFGTEKEIKINPAVKA